MENPTRAAAEAGLRYVSDEGPGIRRVSKGRHFSYLDPAGKAVRGKAELARISALAVPPAYSDVWICPLANGHIQATARDARGRKQYRYHKRWREVRDETKFHRLIAFAEALPRIRKRIEIDLSLPGLAREKVLAAVVQLLESTTIRVGNDEYARDNDSYGLTTMLNKHVTVNGSTMRFAFKGKSGVKHALSLRDRRIAKIVRACQDVPGQELFAYLDDDGGSHDVTSADVNDYIRDISGGDFTAKDFRTWVGTLECARILAGAPQTETVGERNAQLVDAVKRVAQRLGNTAAVCKKSYIHPAVLDAYAETGRMNGADERFLVKFLKKCAAQTPERRTTHQLRQSLRQRAKK